MLGQYWGLGFRAMLGQYWDTGKENGSYYNGAVLRLGFRDNRKENGNYCRV